MEVLTPAEAGHGDVLKTPLDGGDEDAIACGRRQKSRDECVKALMGGGYCVGLSPNALSEHSSQRYSHD